MRSASDARSCRSGLMMDTVKMLRFERGQGLTTTTKKKKKGPLGSLCGRQGGHTARRWSVSFFSFPFSYNKKKKGGG